MSRRSFPVEEGPVGSFARRELGRIGLRHFPTATNPPSAPSLRE